MPRTEHLNSVASNRIYALDAQVLYMHSPPPSSSKTTLKPKSKSPLPFSMRPNSSEKAPPITLGTATSERMGGSVSETQPTLLSQEEKMHNLLTLCLCPRLPTTPSTSPNTTFRPFYWWFQLNQLRQSLRMVKIWPSASLTVSLMAIKWMWLCGTLTCQWKNSQESG